VVAAKRETDMQRSIRPQLAVILVATAAFLAAASPGLGKAPASFFEAFEIAVHYHRELSLLPERFRSDPETADAEFRRLTQEALARQREVEVHPCFAEWWAYELMGLELMALSHELRAVPSEVNAEADGVELLGSGMWRVAYTLVPPTSEACHAAPDAGGPGALAAETEEQPADDEP
jgi:hypothetical protein